MFLRRRRRFTSRKLYACLEKFLCFLQLSDRDKFLELDVQGSFSFDSSITTGFEINSYRASLLTVLRVVYVTVRLGSGKTMVSILHMDLISTKMGYTGLHDFHHVF